MKLLWGISTVGTGHVFRNLDIARELERIIGPLDITFVSGGVAARVMASEAMCLDLLPPTPVPSKDGWVDVIGLARGWLGGGEEAQRVAERLIAETHPDAVLSDEIPSFALAGKAAGLPSIYLTDFCFVDVTRPYRRNWLVNLVILGLGWKLARDVRRAYERMDLTVYLNDVADLSPFWREWATQRAVVVGPVASARGAVVDRATARRARGLLPGDRLIVVTVGGSDAGLYLAKAARAALPMIRRELLTVRMVAVLGPALDPAAPEFDPAEGFSAHGYVPDLVEWMAASDLVICNAGLSTLSEIALHAKVPAIVSPLGSHWEQEANAKAAVRAGWAVSIERARLEPEALARESLAILSNPQRWAQMAEAACALEEPAGAHRAAEAIAQAIG